MTSQITNKGEKIMEKTCLECGKPIYKTVQYTIASRAFGLPYEGCVCRYKKRKIWNRFLRFLYRIRVVQKI